MKLLITGATGFVGRNLVSRIDKKHDICLIVLDHKEAEKFYTDKFKLIESKKKDFKEQIRDFNPNLVIHLASYLTSRYDTETLKLLLDSNITFGSMLLDALMKTDVKYFVNTGSFAEYLTGPEKLDPAYLYAATKIAFRQILDFYRKLKGFKVVQVVPYTIYGVGDTHKKVIDYIIDSFTTNEPIKMTKGEQVLDFVYITDVVDFYLKLISRISKIKGDYKEYHVGTGVGTSIRQVTKLIEEISCKKAKIKWGAIPYRPRDVMRAIAPIEEVEKELGWKAKVSLKEGLKTVMRVRR